MAAHLAETKAQSLIPAELTIECLVTTESHQGQGQRSGRVGSEVHQLAVASSFPSLATPQQSHGNTDPLIREVLNAIWAYA